MVQLTDFDYSQTSLSGSFLDSLKSASSEYHEVYDVEGELLYLKSVSPAWFVSKKAMRRRMRTSRSSVLLRCCVVAPGANPLCLEYHGTCGFERRVLVVGVVFGP